MAGWRRVAVTGGFRLLAVAGTSLWVELVSGPPSYASFRQARAQEVPGTLGVMLMPPPDDFRPAVTPQEAYRAVVRRPAPRGIVPALAVVSSPYARSSDEIPAWVIVGRGVCDASSKGDVVSVGRSNPEAGRLPCTNDNLLMAVVDARTRPLGRRLSRVRRHGKLEACAGERLAGLRSGRGSKALPSSEPLGIRRRVQAQQEPSPGEVLGRQHRDAEISVSTVMSASSYRLANESRTSFDRYWRHS